MASWFVLEPAKTLPDTLRAADKAIFIKDGFSIGAFLFAPVWLLWRRMWLVFLGWLAVFVAANALFSYLRLGENFAGVLMLIIGYGFALEANALRAWSLRRKGWRFAGIASGADLGEAELRHFQQHGLRPDPVPPMPGPTHYRDGTPVLGVLPEPQG